MTEEEWIKIGNNWKTTSSKVQILFPTLDSIMGDISGKEILDSGCGDGAFIRRCKEKDAITMGIDISDKAIEGCKNSDPLGKYLIMDTKNIILEEEFDWVLSLFVLLSFDNKKKIEDAIKSMGQRLNKTGKLVIVIPHPTFEESDNAETMKRSFDEEYLYSKKGLKINYKSKTKGYLAFTDFHWMIEDYVECIKKAGLVIEDIKEPIPAEKYKEENLDIYTKRVKYPTMIVFVCSRKR
ncbi:MAG: methyltransferase domain-containing protein [Candidatus ainarchaeum sp.]|nr:methyltransferase domain-containing protein [Candidatus ainarchaeum sp.]